MHSRKRRRYAAIEATRRATLSRWIEWEEGWIDGVLVFWFYFFLNESFAKRSQNARLRRAGGRSRRCDSTKNCQRKWITLFSCLCRNEPICEECERKVYRRRLLNHNTALEQNFSKISKCCHRQKVAKSHRRSQSKRKKMRRAKKQKREKKNGKQLMNHKTYNLYTFPSCIWPRRARATTMGTQLFPHSIVNS